MGANAYEVAGMFDEHWYAHSMKEFENTVEINKLSDQEQSRWDEALKKMLADWADELENKGLMAKKALSMFKEELAKVDVPFNACPVP